MNVTGIILIFILLLGFLGFRIYSAAVTMKSGQNRESRLVRIKKVSFVIQILMGICMVMGFYEFLAFLFGWPTTLGDRRILIGHEHSYTTAGEMPVAVMWLWIVKMLLAFWGSIMLLRLFWLYGRGILFSAKNVTCIRFFGWWIIIDWFIEFEIRDLLHDMGISTTPLIVGMLVIFAAWIMDEGRKIQEEQELTV